MECVCFSNAAGHLRCLFEAAVSEAHLSESTGDGGDRGGGWRVIWLEDVTMRYGREEGRLSDTATRWCRSVMYNGNTREQNGSQEPTP